MATVEDIRQAQETQAKLYQSAQEVLMVRNLAQNSDVATIEIKGQSGMEEIHNRLVELYHSLSAVEHIVVLTCPLVNSLLPPVREDIRVVVKYETTVRNQVYVVIVRDPEDQFTLQPRLKVAAVYDVEQYVEHLSQKSTTSLSFGE